MSYRKRIRKVGESLFKLYDDLSFVCLNPHYLLKYKRYLLIVSHMRSRSSLLSHILGSHSEIEGYSERHRSYFSRVDLAKMYKESCNDGDAGLDGHYALDKVLHNYRFIDDTVFRDEKVKVLFLLREPEETFKSILHMDSLTEVKLFQDVGGIRNYYRERLKKLEQYSSLVNGDALYVNSRELIERTDPVLDTITRWLGLENDLSSEYATFENTGKPGYGDPSDMIKSGRIKKEKKKHSNIVLPDRVKEDGRAIYRQCERTLQKNCMIVPTDS